MQKSIYTKKLIALKICSFHSSNSLFSSYFFEWIFLADKFYIISFSCVCGQCTFLKFISLTCRKHLLPIFDFAQKTQDEKNETEKEKSCRTTMLWDLGICKYFIAEIEEQRKAKAK